VNKNKNKIKDQFQEMGSVSLIKSLCIFIANKLTPSSYCLPQYMILILQQFY